MLAEALLKASCSIEDQPAGLSLFQSISPPLGTSDISACTYVQPECSLALHKGSRFGVSEFTAGCFEKNTGYPLHT